MNDFGFPCDAAEEKAFLEKECTTGELICAGAALAGMASLFCPNFSIFAPSETVGVAKASIENMVAGALGFPLFEMATRRLGPAIGLKIEPCLPVFHRAKAKLD